MIIKNFIYFRYNNLDFVISFSSIEHSGLGRFGDPMDPIGDLREMQKLWCLMKPGALLFIGLPTGQDEVIFNSYRIYGDIRWPMIAANFEVLGYFYGNDPKLTFTPPKMHSTKFNHYLYVLRKR